MIDNEKTNDIVDTTDCLEAVGAFKAMKNFLFVLILICLIMLQTIFIIDRLGYIDKSACACKAVAGCTIADSTACTGQTCTIQPGLTTTPDESQTTTPMVSVEVQVEDPLNGEDKISADAKVATAEVGPPSPEEQADKSAQSEEPDSDRKRLAEILIPKCRHITALIKACNFILIITATVYCLILLMSLKISLSGRLGGINHISRAFFISLFALVLLLPWQLCFPSVIAGVIYTPKELLCSCKAATQTSVLCTIFVYIRFTGMWLIEILLMLLAQLRSARWSRATLRRLGILQ